MDQNKSDDVEMNSDEGVQQKQTLESLGVEGLKALVDYALNRIEELQAREPEENNAQPRTKRQKTEDGDGFQLAKNTTKKFNTTSIVNEKGQFNNNPYSPLANHTDTETQVAGASKSNADIEKINEKCPPIVLREASKWLKISKDLMQKNIKYLKARTTSEGIRIFAETPADFRMLTKYLEQNSCQFHTFKFRSEQCLKIVIKGIDNSIDTAEVENDLKEQGYVTQRITRMQSRLGKDLPMMLIDIDRIYRSIYSNLKMVCGLEVTLEAKRRKKSSGQCHRCQKFNHSQENCKAEYRCLKCGMNHSTHLCTKPKTTEATCANCGGKHPANFRGCPEHPENKKKEPATLISKKTVPEVSYSQALRGPKHHTTEEKKTTEPQPAKTENNQSRPNNKQYNKEKIATIIGKLFIQYCETKPTTDKSLEFLKTTQDLLKEIN